MSVHASHKKRAIFRQIDFVMDISGVFKSSVLAKLLADEAGKVVILGVRPHLVTRALHGTKGRVTLGHGCALGQWTDWIQGGQQPLPGLRAGPRLGPTGEVQCRPRGHFCHPTHESE